MGVLNVQSITQAGVSPTFSAAGAAGDSFANTEKTYFHVKNGGGSSITVTVDSVAKCNHGFDHDLAITVPPSGEKIIGPFPAARFNDDTSKVNVTYSAVTSVTVAAFRL